MWLMLVIAVLLDGYVVNAGDSCLAGRLCG